MDKAAMSLDQVMRDVPYRSWHGAREIPIHGVTHDSRRVEPGDLFCAWTGEHSDGLKWMRDALGRGARALVLERAPNPLPDCPTIVVASARRTLSLAAANRFGHPAKALQVIGITGTNGKTSGATILHSLLNDPENRCGLLGTIEVHLGSRVETATRTTPEGSDLQAYLAEMRDAGCHRAVMEVSSHALAQGRVEGLPFTGALFTNLSPDHLDFHKDMESYFLAKAELFRRVMPGGFAIVPAEGEYPQRLRQMIPGDVRCWSYGTAERADSRARDVQYYRNGTSFIWEIGGKQVEVSIPYIGRHNLENALVALTAAVACGKDPETLTERVAQAPMVPGRLQRVAPDEMFTILIDYAHTEDALRNVLEALHPLRENRIKTLIGCGGNRDISKRPAMARVACLLSDEVVFTSDNPRDEDPEKILKEMTDGVSDFCNYEVEPDRHRAIQRLLETAVRGDILLIAGKGHEPYQEIKGERHRFLDAEVVEELLRER